LAPHVDDRALPGHPEAEGAHFVERDVGTEADAAFAGAARDGVLNSVAGEDFQAAIIELGGDVYRDFLGRGTQDFVQTIVHIEGGGGLVKAGFAYLSGLEIGFRSELLLKTMGQFGFAS
jgi:hypothetical protein